MSLFRKKIKEVFTPRSAEVNDAMYIPRPHHQKELKRAVEGSMHAVLCGESGSGKSWLQRHVAQREGWKTYYANAGNAARCKSLTATIADSVFDESDREWVEYTQNMGGEIGAFGIGGSAETGRKYEVKSRELLLRVFEAAKSKAGGDLPVIVIDNLEAIFKKQDLMEELGNIILLLDDPDYAKYGVKLLIVGVPAEVVEYFQQIDNLETVANRLKEVPSVIGMNWGQIENFVRKGFNDQLKAGLTVDQVALVAKHVENVTLGIAQRMHEYCEILAFNIEDSEWKFDIGLLENADRKYLNSCLKQAYAVVDASMNERKTRAGRRNQVLYALSKTQNSEFDANEIEAIVRSEFPDSTSGVKLAVGQILAELSSGTTSLLKRASKAANYRFSDPRYLMCMRVVLGKSATGEKVLKATWRR